jgi:hypothetical protein
MLLYYVASCFYQDDDDDDEDDVSGDIGLGRVTWIALRPLLTSFVGTLSSLL